MRQVSLEVGRENSLFIHVTLVSYLRADEPIEQDIFKKIALFCNVKPDCVIENTSLSNLYEAPLMLEKQNSSAVVCRELGLKAHDADLAEWETLVSRIKNRAGEVTDLFVIPDAHRLLQSALGVLPLQLFACYVALNRGCDIDKPRNLAKSVTME